MILGTFFLGKNEFALPLEVFQEVLTLPENLTSVPLAPPYMLGVLNLRGQMVTVVDAKKLLGIGQVQQASDAAYRESSKVVVIDLGAAKLGLVVDATGEIFTLPDAEAAELKKAFVTNSQAKTQLVNLNGGKRVVQLLNPTAIITVENLSVMSAFASNCKQVIVEKVHRGSRKQCITFVVRGMHLAFEISAISEIIKPTEIETGPLVSELCLGLIRLRGHVLPVLDFTQLLGVARQPVQLRPDSRVLVLKSKEGPLGLFIDSVANIVHYFNDEVLPVPLFNQVSIRLLKGLIVKQDQVGGEILLLNSDEVANSDAVLQLVKGHANVYRDTEKTTAAAKEQTTQKAMYITFKVGYLLAVPLNSVGEIINFSSEIVELPSSPPFVMGQLNLRGDVVTIVDMRKLYGLQTDGSKADRKILIFRNADKKSYGLVVDAIENILGINQNDKLEVPSVLMREPKEFFQDDIREGLQVDFGKGNSKSVLILDIETVKRRVEKGLGV